MLLGGCQEGMSGWLVALREAMALSAQLARTFVLPCVRGGRLVPCAPGEVLAVPPEDSANATLDFLGGAAEDAAAFPAFREDCTGASRRSLPEGGGAAFPLHAYFSRAGIAAIVRSAERAARVSRGSLVTVDFVDWARARGLGRAAEHGRIVAPMPALDFSKQGACFFKEDEGAGSPFAHGVFDFPRGKLCALALVGRRVRPHVRMAGAAVGVHKKLAAGAWAAAPDVFVASWMRSKTHRFSDVKPLPPVHPAHVAATARWLRAALPGGAAGGGSHGSWPAASYAVVQWRSETLGVRFPACASHVVSALEQLVGRLSQGSRRVPVLLVTDLSAPANPCGPSFNYGGGSGAAEDHLGAFANVSHLLLKYDAALASTGRPPLDAGVMSLREFMLAAQAEHYATCNGRFKRVGPLCSQCSWISEFISRVVVARTASGRKSLESFLDHFSGQQRGSVDGPPHAHPPTPDSIVSDGDELGAADGADAAGGPVATGDEGASATLAQLPFASALSRLTRRCPSGTPMLRCIQRVLTCWSLGNWTGTGSDAPALRAQWEWGPHAGCSSFELPRFNATDWCRVHAGLRVVLIGDLHSQDVFYATQHMLQSGGLPVQPTFVECGSNATLPPYVRGCGAFRVPGCDATVAFVRSDRLRLQVASREWDASAGTLSHPIAGVVDSVSPTHVVLGGGADLSSDVAAYRDGLVAAAREVGECAPAAQILWRNTPQGHPGCAAHSGPVSSPLPLLAGSDAQMRRDATRRNNEIMRGVADHGGMLLLDFAAPAALRPDMHRSAQDCHRYRDEDASLDSPLHHWVRLSAAAVWLSSLLVVGAEA